VRLGGGYTASPVPVEGALGVWTAANTRGGLSLAGGQVTLLPDCLVFTPWDVSGERELLVKLLTKAGVPHVGDVDKLITQSKLLEPVVVPLQQIESLEQLNGASWLRPPTVRIRLADGRHFDLGILVSPRRLNKDSANDNAMADFLAKTRRTLNQVLQRPAPG
jgi:hypothetical protein